MSYFRSPLHSTRTFCISPLTPSELLATWFTQPSPCMTPNLSPPDSAFCSKPTSHMFRVSATFKCERGSTVQSMGSGFLSNHQRSSPPEGADVQQRRLSKEQTMANGKQETMGPGESTDRSPLVSCCQEVLRGMVSSRTPPREVLYAKGICSVTSLISSSSSSSEGRHKKTSFTFLLTSLAFLHSCCPGFHLPNEI